MILRRDRIHLSGASNLSHSTPKKSAAFQTAPLKTPGDTFPLSTKHSDPNPVSPSKHGKVLDVISKKASRTAVGPTEETMKFYEETHKPLKLKIEIGSPRVAQLEDKDKMKTVFTGESHLIYDKNLEKYRDFEKSADVVRNPQKKEVAKKKTKLTEHAQAIQETQLVGFDKYNNQTINNNIDLEKVREARRVLRRKYANRRNLQKIYSTWDEENAGLITADNVYNMSKKLGLNLNFDEARVLLASANRTSSGSLNLDEFLDLIYNKDDVLNVDLDKLAKNTNQGHVVKKEELENTNIISQLQDDAKKARDIKRMNQLKLVLKNRIPDIRQAILELDRDKSGYVNHFKFEQALQRLRINQNIISSQDISEVFEKFKTDSTKLNYRDFLEHLQAYTFDYDKEYVDLAISPKKKTQAHLNIEEHNSKPLDIVDCRNLPLNMIENCYVRSKKVGRAIQQFLPNKDALNDYIAKRLNIQDMENGYVSMKEFKGVMKDMFHKFEVKHIDQRDMEGFLSSILYNKHGFTTIKEVGHTIYDEEEKDFMNKVQMKKKGPEPQLEKRFFTQSTDNLKSIKLTPLELDASPGEKSLLPTINTKRASQNDLELKRTNSSSKYVVDKDLGNVLQGLDDKLFLGTKSFYKVFKEFDVDGDGYISHQDFAAKLQNANLAKKQDIPRILDYLDPQQKGFVDFTEFSQKIKRNMANTGEDGDSNSKSSMNFTKPNFVKAWESVRSTRKFFEETRNSFDPQHQKPYDSKLVTRSGAHPGWSNTFLNFQSPSNSAMFVSEDERFYKHRLASTMFQADERRRKELVQEGRLEARRTNQNIIADRIARQMAVEDSRELSKRHMKSENMARYENTAKLKNVYT